MLAKGDILDGRYVIEEPIGSGGYGTVYRAMDRKAKHAVAIKVLRSDLADDPDYRRRFRREADIAQMLKSDHVVRVLETGSARLKEEDIHFQVMELVSGDTLQARLKKGRIPVLAALQIAAQLTEALEEAEEREIVHRDIKPKNIFVGRNDFARLGDFGVAKATDYPSLKSDDPILGTPRYMSPEQCVGTADESSIRSDIYSLGIVLYEMIWGRPPFEGDSPSVIAYKHVNEKVKPLRDQVRGVSRELDTLIQRCLEKRPEDRFQHARELRAALWAVAEGHRTGDDTPVTPVGPLVRRRRHVRLPRMLRVRSLNRLHIPVAGGCLVVALIVFGTVVWATNGDDSKTGGTPSVETTGDENAARDIGSAQPSDALTPRSPAATKPTVTPTSPPSPSPKAQQSPSSTQSGGGINGSETPLAPGIPAAPSGLRATAVDPHRVRLEWSDNSSNELGFEVWNNLSPSITVAANSETYMVSGLAALTHVCYRVRSYNSAGSSSQSPEVCIDTPDEVFVVSLSASATSVAGGASVTLTATSDVNVGPTSYFFRILENGSVIAYCGNGTTCQYAVTGAGVTKTYIAQISSYDGANIRAATAPIEVTWGGISAGVFNVSSAIGWQQTGVYLSAGQVFTIVYESGCWTIDYANYSCVDPGGYSAAEDGLVHPGCKVDSSQPYGTLLANVGNGNSHAIGTGGTFSADGEGYLYLRINDADACLSDNSGSITVSVAAVL